MIEESESVYLIDGNTLIDEINDMIDINLKIHEAETLSGRLTEKVGHLPDHGQQIPLAGGVLAEVVSVKDRRVLRVRVTLPKSPEPEE